MEGSLPIGGFSGSKMEGSVSFLGLEMHSLRHHCEQASKVPSINSSFNAPTVSRFTRVSSVSSTA